MPAMNGFYLAVCSTSVFTNNHILQKNTTLSRENKMTLSGWSRCSHWLRSTEIKETIYLAGLPGILHYPMMGTHLWHTSYAQENEHWSGVSFSSIIFLKKQNLSWIRNVILLGQGNVLILNLWTRANASASEMYGSEQKFWCKEAQRK